MRGEIRHSPRPRRASDRRRPRCARRVPAGAPARATRTGRRSTCRHPRSRRLASDSQVSSSVRAPSSRCFQSRGGSSVGGQSRRQLVRGEEIRAPLIRLAPQELGRVRHVTRLIEDEEGLRAEVIERRRRCQDAAPTPRPHRPRPRRGIRPLRAAGPRRRPAAPGPARRRAARGHARVARGGASLPRPRRSRIAGRRVLRQQELGGGEQHDPLDLADRPLVGRVEGAQRVDLVAERLDSDGQLRRWREDVDEPAAPRELAAARHLEDRRVAQLEELAEERRLADPRADLQLQGLLGQVVRRDRVLEQRLDARHEDAGASGPPCRRGPPRARPSRPRRARCARRPGLSAARAPRPPPDRRSTRPAPPRRDRRSRSRARPSRSARPRRAQAPPRDSSWRRAAPP